MHAVNKQLDKPEFEGLLGGEDGIFVQKSLTKGEKHFMIHLSANADISLLPEPGSQKSKRRCKQQG